MSSKFHVIDHATFEKMQQSCSREAFRTPVQRIRNGKYKRMAARDNFNLLQFVKVKTRCNSGLGRKGKIRHMNGKVQYVDPRNIIKNKGKQRENGRIKKPSRLKKSILQYRKMKREQEQLEEQINGAINKLEQLKLNKTENKGNMVPSIHSRKFRAYCNCCTTPELKKHSEELVRELNFFQRRAYAQNEIKARAHRRLVVGFRQVQNYLRINKIKLVIIATDCEHNEGDVSLDEIIENIKTTCNDNQIPVVFAFQRRELAYILYKKASISCIGILDYDGARVTFSQLLEALKNAREEYKSLCLKESK